MSLIQCERKDETELSVTAILALGFNHIKSVLIALFIGLILIGGWKCVKTLKAASKTLSAQYLEENEKALEDYEFKHELLSTTFNAIGTQYNYLSSKNKSSPLMALKSDNAVKAIITMAVDSENTANQYVNYFNSINLSDELKDLSELAITATKNVELDVDTTGFSRSFNNLNSTVNFTRNESLTNQDYTFDEYFKNCFLKLTVYGKNEKEALANADYLFELLKGGREVVTAISGQHNFMLIDRYAESGTDIAEIQYSRAVKLQSIADELLSLKYDIEELEKNAPVKIVVQATTKPSMIGIIKGTVKWAIIGAVFGAFLVCLYLLIGFIGSSPVYSSFEFADHTKLSYLGGIYKKRSWNQRIADRLLNERIFTSEVSASSFIFENVKSRVKVGKKMLIASSYYNLCESDKSEISFVLDNLKAAGYDVEFAGDALTSAKFVEKLNLCDCVIIMEKRWKSQWQNVEYELETISHFDKEIIGFLLS